MPKDEALTGQRFSLLYLRSEKTLSDCRRMRRRLGTLVRELVGKSDYTSVELAKFLEAELGIGIVRSGAVGSYVSWVRFFEEAELTDVLDAITLIYRYGIAKRLIHRQGDYQRSVQRIFNERNMRYRVDEECGVHPNVDTAFEQIRASAIAGLGKERFNAARAHLESAEQALTRKEPDNRQAIRSVFDAVENIFKRMFQGVTHVSNQSIQTKLRPMIEASFTDQPAVVKSASLKQCDSFKSWIEAAHFYRHADDQPEPAQPPSELAILMVSQGYGWIRWLAQLAQSSDK